MIEIKVSEFWEIVEDYEGREEIIIPDKNTRTSEVLINGEWQSIKPIDIKNGMIFRLFESDGESVTWGIVDSWTALSDAYLTEDGVITVETN